MVKYGSLWTFCYQNFKSKNNVYCRLPLSLLSTLLLPSPPPPPPSSPRNSSPLSPYITSCYIEKSYTFENSASCVIAIGPFHHINNINKPLKQTFTHLLLVAFAFVATYLFLTFSFTESVCCS